jgi:hypothetical protein
MTIKNENQQICIFCNRKDKDMPVYSVCLGRLGICLDCAEKARMALLAHLNSSSSVPIDREIRP